MQIIGHRGARGEAPENTLSGFKYLKSLGIRAVELDIHVAQDGQLVVIHDDSVDRTTNATGLITEKSSTDLALLNACSHFKQTWPYHDGVPTLAAVLSCLSDFEHLQLEVKVKTPSDYLQIAEQLPALWQNFGQKAATTSFNVEYLRLMQQQAPQIPRGLLVESDFTGDIFALAQELSCGLIAPYHQLLTTELIEHAHAVGLKVSTWTVNEPSRMIKLRDMGLDSLITDYPTLALQILV